MKYMLGANYWGRRWGTEMWLHYDGAEIRQELKELYEWGVRTLRVFPNWRDFQPVEKAYSWQGGFGEYINANTGEPVYGDGVDEGQIENFRDFCHAAEDVGMQLVVSIVTGWMSGRLFTPPALNGKNLITDPEALMWMRRFIRRFVHEFKNESCIISWDLGNECNCLGKVETEYQAYQWTATVTDAIRSEDTTRPISSGMHALQSGMGTSCWSIEHQGELCDILTTHPYPSPTVGGDVEPYTRLRMTFLPTAQTLYYSGVSKKEGYIQESGTFSQAIGSRKMSADFMRIQILSSIANGLCGYQWWCAWEQSHLDFPPYSWCMMERELGMFDKDEKPKPVAYVMKEMSSLLDKLPSPFPKRIVDGVCILSRGQNRQNVAISTLTLAKQAGLDLDVVFSENGDIPESNLYFMPVISGWQVMYKKSWDVISERVKNGATLYISSAGGHLISFPETVGAESMGVMSCTSHSFTLDGKSHTYGGKEILLSPTTAEVIIRNEEGNPVLLKNQYGKGCIYYCNFAPEQIAFDMPDGFNKMEYYRLYSIVAEKAIENKLVRTDNSNLGVTVNPEDENTSLMTVLNYSDEDIKPIIKIKDGWKLKEIIYGNLENISACDGIILRIEKS